MSEHVMLHIMTKSAELVRPVTHMLEGSTVLGYYHAYRGDGFVHVMIVPREIVDPFIDTLNAEAALKPVDRKLTGVELVVVTPIVSTWRYGGK